MSDLAAKTDRLLGLLRSYESCAVAFSGGVDSSVVAQAARDALGDRALAVTGVSASLAAGELEAARDLAAQIGIRHVVIHTEEFENPLYVQNVPDRCFHCKTELYSRLVALRGQLGVAVVAAGANADDLADFRPGMRAASEHEVQNPLAECGFTKQDVRALAASSGLPVWDKPATPCLSSRIAYGEEVTPDRLAMIDRAEQYLRRVGLETLRVRYHKGDLARIEVPIDAIDGLCRDEVRGALVAELHSLGFKFVTLDLAGFRSGSLNVLLPPEVLNSPPK